MAASQLQPKKLNVWAGLVYFLLFMDQRYIKAATRNSIEVSIRSADYKRKHDAGSWPLNEDVESLHETNAARLKKMRKEFWSAAAWTLLIIAFSIGVLTLLSKSPCAGLTAPKVVSSIGGALAAWGTIFQLIRADATFKASEAHELMRPPLFLLLFVPGSVLAIAGTLA
ncbi:hypothetical protein DelCs14_2694 [Delftia sp. Cs1-4]|nr:hypothetical protein DelCs14_2694 [Delftia sp. Cs1-4]